jgi:hypothetical protein
MHLELVFFKDEQRLSSSFYKDQRSVQINGSYSNEHFSQTEEKIRLHKNQISKNDLLKTSS